MTLTPLADGFCFGEGPRWFEGLVWFSDMLGEAVHTVTLDGATSTLALPGHAPSGLGFRPDGTLLIVSTELRQVLGYDGETVVTVADLSALVPANLGDMTVDRHGCAYVGSQARDGGVIVRVDPDTGRATVVAENLQFPNGMALTADGATLIVAESTGRRLTAYSVADDGTLSDRRIFADGLDGPPDGICLDDEGGVWVGMTLAHQFERVVETGGQARVTDRIDMGGRTAIACTLGGPEGRTLFLVTTTDAYPERLRGTTLSRLDAVTVDVPAAGFVGEVHVH
ncbi:MULTISPECIES: SMP-30/gluconolactonase/LRE family protein [Mycolicibacterium]|uniref:Gluconolactonase n=3 Tax=Mycolicibacterium gilvum TaxID=1804 RepID=E6TGE9_MYCSR|nr:MULTISPECIES: SMP-30/gluconolactonase/LRE family protein [Mycolicibacterium]ABP46579.1 gluconolactonase [Mycolicibacterium gilvum PYR-GCK]ADU00064.1 gluconolactonase [Mycolicibacterium gilvum Spyr1]MBV5242707.1 SMP-30/gluconolactonase/LRE family protein [Mycolicibacterium sp. PAM1]MCV7057949.1 SMP-30/gluconolactonase/LRE family protein [Mycolicibacterium gilvum]STZ42926.1 SMP-30/gluconolaconase/LRE domain-containing protein [Mycolicibacterium gilvum]